MPVYLFVTNLSAELCEDSNALLSPACLGSGRAVTWASGQCTSLTIQQKMLWFMIIHTSRVPVCHLQFITCLNVLSLSIRAGPMLRHEIHPTSINAVRIIYRHFKMYIGILVHPFMVLRTSSRSALFQVIYSSERISQRTSHSPTKISTSVQQLPHHKHLRGYSG